MEIVEQHDLRIAVLDAREAESGDTLPDEPGIDMVRIVDPTPQLCAELAPRGFLFKPQWLFWSRPVHPTVEAYLDTLGARTRKHTRQALRKTAQGHRLEVETPIDPARLDVWYRLYERHIASLPRGTLYAAEDLADFRAHPDRVVGLYLYDGDRMAAGLICLKVPRNDMLRITYFAADQERPDPGITPYMYVQAGVVAAELGYGKLSAGADPNFYGHDVATGLYRLKKRLGFRADPLWRFEADDPPVLERVVSLARCEDPSFCVSYSGFDPTESTLVGNVFSARPDIDTTHFGAPMFSSVEARPVTEREVEFL
ncbi:hypothetical protein SGFS_066750 [Streptomyces graminofaciens]|uniref:BioF2-like acetyltransferase domain-containing protein n=1 Tax=Streptomyces graminofaciens TaxID=68212 RepID=A0ABN5VPK9_9ACTN|nr:GNAT family N-acetyltransferase [Streptomyces graminofaciens]BBC35381.1 hypothetical protein SGFS_066750 [Streptomyces graminofaciens]